MMGDEGKMSGLIATNHDQLEVLKHKGDRNYVEFTLQKGAQPTLLSPVKLKLEKVDNKHARFSLVVSSDDRNIEKKDKTLDEPIQFYSGKDPVLFELVVNNIDKNKVSGYLSMPNAERGTLIASPVLRLPWVGLLLLGCLLGCLLDDFLGCFLGCHLSILPIDKTTMLQDINMQLTNV